MSWEASPRRRRRNQLLLAGLFPSLAALLVAALLLSSLVRNERGLAAYGDGDARTARGLFADSRWPGMVEPWKAAFNEGDAHYRLAQPESAVADFRAALRDVPLEHECLVRLNIALARERIGDELGRDQDTARGAEEAWRDARDALAGGRCTEPPGQQDDGVVRERAGRTDQRLERKIEASQAERVRQLTEDLSVAEQRRVRELEEANRRAAETEAKDPSPPRGQDEEDGPTYSW